MLSSVGDGDVADGRVEGDLGDAQRCVELHGVGLLAAVRRGAAGGAVARDTGGDERGLATVVAVGFGEGAARGGHGEVVLDGAGVVDGGALDGDAVVAPVATDLDEFGAGGGVLSLAGGEGEGGDQFVGGGLGEVLREGEVEDGEEQGEKHNGS